MNEADLLASALQQDGWPAGLTPKQWDLLLRQGRRANLLARLALKGDTGPPAAMVRHMRGARILAEHQRAAVRREVDHVRDALGRSGVPFVLLKGAAYVLAGLPAAEGRLFSDIDILVPKASLPAAEATLMRSGWISAHHSAYDQRYYRQWMHELPPLQHMQRGTTIDVHHAILPETARIRADTEALRRAAIPLATLPGVFVLAPHDMVLHSATHLFHEGELHNGLRDLADIDSLLRHFGRDSDFWAGLVPRAFELGLQRPLFYALRYARHVLGAPVPPPVIKAADRARPSPPVLCLMDALYRRGLRPDHPSAEDALTGLARWMLYMRGHWLRMPFFLLIYHLARKALIRNKPQHESRPADDA